MTENIPECGGSIWLVLTIASGDYFDFDKLFDIVDEDALNPMVGEAEKEARARRELGLQEEHQDEALASREKDECEPMEVATEVVVKSLFIYERSTRSSKMAWSVDRRFQAEDSRQAELHHQERRAKTSNTAGIGIHDQR